jgi:uncharacterized sulfatase
MIRADRFKYIFNQGTVDELYDLENDPGETTNLIDRADLNPVRKDLRERLFAWYNPERNPYGGK